MDFLQAMPNLADDNHDPAGTWIVASWQ